MTESIDFKENYGIILKETNVFQYEKIEYDYENIPADYCIIENKACGLGPYDTGFITGRLQVLPKREFNIGCEGSGIVIKIGENCDNNLLGKRVAYLANYHDLNTIRSYARYSVIKKDDLLNLPDQMGFDQGAYILGNPTTAKALYDKIISNSKTRAIVLDTSVSSLGKMIIKLCLKNNIKTINIVRKEENKKILEEMGSKLNLNSSSKDFLTSLENIIKEIQPDIYITFQGGNLPTKIFDKMPFDSKMVCCGNINNEKIYGFSTTDFIFKGKSIEGFQILNHLKEISNEEKVELYNSILKSLLAGDSEYYTTFYNEYQLKDFEKALDDYNKNSSLGKILLKP